MIVVALSVSVVAVLLGRWQYGRHLERADELRAFNAAAAVESVPLADVVAGPADPLPDAARWRAVTASGSFDAESLTWLRNRPVDGARVVHALAWFVTDEGVALLVDAGYAPTEPNGVTLATTPVTLSLTLREQEPDDGRRDDGATRIASAQMPAAPASALPGYGVVAACEPSCTASGMLTPTPLPTLGLGPHLSYAWQWWLLAALAPTGAILLIRHDAKGKEASAEPARAPRRATRTDEEIEDAL